MKEKDGGWADFGASIMTKRAVGLAMLSERMTKYGNQMVSHHRQGHEVWNMAKKRVTKHGNQMV